MYPLAKLFLCTSAILYIQDSQEAAAAFCTALKYDPGSYKAMFAYGQSLLKLTQPPHSQAKAAFGSVYRNAFQRKQAGDSKAERYAESAVKYITWCTEQELLHQQVHQDNRKSNEGDGLPLPARKRIKHTDTAPSPVLQDRVSSETKSPGWHFRDPFAV